MAEKLSNGALVAPSPNHRSNTMIKDAVIHSHYCDVIMGVKASQITSLAVVCSTVYTDADQRKHQSSALLAFVRRIHRGPVNSPHKWPVTRKMLPFDDVIISQGQELRTSSSKLCPSDLKNRGRHIGQKPYQNLLNHKPLASFCSWYHWLYNLIVLFASFSCSKVINL